MSNLSSKPPCTPGPDDTTPAMTVPPRLTVRDEKLKSDDKLKFQLRDALMLPSRSCVLFAKCPTGSERVSNKV